MAHAPGAAAPALPQVAEPVAPRHEGLPPPRQLPVPAPPTHAAPWWVPPVPPSAPLYGGWLMPPGAAPPRCRVVTVEYY